MRCCIPWLVMALAGCSTTPERDSQPGAIPRAETPLAPEPPPVVPHPPIDPTGAAAGAVEVAPVPVVPAPEPGWKALHTLPSNAQAYVLHIDPPPSAMPDNEAFRIEVWIAKSATPNDVCRDVSLVVDAGMPEHGHGMNRVPKVTRADDGHFVVEGMYFHMTGHWELYFDVTRGAVTERAQCDVQLAD